MDPAEQLRILEGAKGHPGRLALATVDLAHGDLKEEERVALKMALKAAAVPHWVDEHILSALLSIEYAEALRLLVGLRNLQVVEPFPARGERAAMSTKRPEKLCVNWYEKMNRSFFNLSPRGRTNASSAVLPFTGGSKNFITCSQRTRKPPRLSARV